MIYIPILKLLLILTNIGILILLLNLISIHFKDRNNYKSFSTAFHVLSFIWLCIRGSFWTLSFISTESWDVSTFYLLYWMPCPFQFSSFMLLPLFFSQKLYPAKWKEYWQYSINIYIAIIVFLIVFQIIWTCIAALRMEMISTLCDNEDNENVPDTLSPKPTIPSPVDCYHTEYAGNTFRIIAAVCSLLLAIMQGLYGYKLSHSDNKNHEQFIISNQNHLYAVNVFLVLSFLSRGVYNLRALQHNYLLPDIPLQGDGDVSLTTFICFEIWDYIPTILLLMTVTSKTIVKHNSFGSKITLKSEPIGVPGRSFPQYGAIYNEDDEWKSTSVSSSISSSVETTSFLLEGGSSDIPNRKSTTKRSFSVGQYAPLSLDRFEAPASLTPSSTWLNATVRDENFSRNTHSTTPSNSLENQEKGLMMYYKPYRSREGSLGSDTSNKSDSGRITLRKNFISVTGESDSEKKDVRIERSGTIEKDSKSLPSPVNSPKINIRNSLGTVNNSDTSTDGNKLGIDPQNSKELAVPRPSRSFQVLSPAAIRVSTTSQPISDSLRISSSLDPNRRLKKRESKAVIQTPPDFV